MTREPGDLPGRRHLPACGARARGGLPLWWQRGTVERTGATAMPMLLPISANH